MRNLCYFKNYKEQINVEATTKKRKNLNLYIYIYINIYILHKLMNQLMDKKYIYIYIQQTINERKPLALA